jgi:hypothetical protein
VESSQSRRSILLTGKFVWNPLDLSGFYLINKGLDCLSEINESWQGEKPRLFPFHAGSNPQFFPQKRGSAIQSFPRPAAGLFLSL